MTGKSRLGAFRTISNYPCAVVARLRGIASRPTLLRLIITIEPIGLRAKTNSIRNTLLLHDRRLSLQPTGLFHKGAEREGVMIFGEGGGTDGREGTIAAPGANDEFMHAGGQFPRAVRLP